MAIKSLMRKTVPKCLLQNMSFFQQQFLSHPLLKCDLYCEGAYQVCLFFQILARKHTTDSYLSSQKRSANLASKGFFCLFLKIKQCMINLKYDLSSCNITSKLLCCEKRFSRSLPHIIRKYKKCFLNKR